jgi:hypothetical protein
MSEARGGGTQEAAHLLDVLLPAHREASGRASGTLNGTQYAPVRHEQHTRADEDEALVGAHLGRLEAWLAGSKRRERRCVEARRAP